LSPYPRPIDEPWSQPPIETSASPWEEVENPEHSTYKPPRQPDELWTQLPLQLSSAPWSADASRTVQPRAPVIVEPWALAPSATSTSEPWATEQAPHSAQRLQPLDFPWALAPVTPTPPPPPPPLPSVTPGSSSPVPFAGLQNVGRIRRWIARGWFSDEWAEADAADAEAVEFELEPEPAPSPAQAIATVLAVVDAADVERQLVEDELDEAAPEPFDDEV